MVLSLNILRGVDLVAMDTNLISANSSDPYCEVYVNGKKIGWTPTQYATLNPVWGGPMSTFRIIGGGGTKIEIKLFDFDELSADDPMGTVTFHVRDLLERKSKDHYPNFWATVKPPKGYEDVPSGRLQIRLLEATKEKNLFAKPVSLGKKAVKVSPGPRLYGIPKSLIRESIASARTPVILHVYDVGKNTKVQNLNNALPYMGMGGVFHGAIEVYGREYSFGGSTMNVCGVFICNPAGCPMHTYRESIYLGDCSLNRQQVVAVLRRMKPEWMAPTYHFLQKNCCTFSDEFATELGVGGIPDWVLSLANIGAGLNHMMGCEVPTDDLHDYHKLRTTWRSLDVKDTCREPVQDTTLEHVMAVRLQRTFRASQAKVESEYERIQMETVNTYEGKLPVQIRRATVNIYNGQGFEVGS